MIIEVYSYQLKPGTLAEAILKQDNMLVVPASFSSIR